MDTSCYHDHVQALAKTGGVCVVEVSTMDSENGSSMSGNKQLLVGASGGEHCTCGGVHGIAAVPAEKVVVIATVRDAKTYAIALHELGHMIADGGHLPNERRAAGKAENTLLQRTIQLAEEQVAWDWARANALEWTPEMEAVRTWAYATYQGGLRAEVDRYIVPPTVGDGLGKTEKTCPGCGQRNRVPAGAKARCGRCKREL